MHHLIKKIAKANPKKVNIIKKFSRFDKKLSIQYAYEHLAGSYTRQNIKFPKMRDRTTNTMSDILKKLGPFDSLLEVGCGECTNLYRIIKKCKFKNKKILGFDLSFSRIFYSLKNLKKKISKLTLFQGDLFNIPLENNSIDIVYTLHSLEPNGGKEIEALKELYRITKNYLILYEPMYEFGTKKVKKHIDDHGYVKNLYKYCKKLNYNVIRYSFLYNSLHSNNNSGIIIIKKNNIKNKKLKKINFVCPLTKQKLIKRKNYYYEKIFGLAYPVIENIPCLLQENKIVALKIK